MNGQNSVSTRATSTVAVVPAKMTSTRLPRKNILDLGGRPLFYYSVRVAQLVSGIDAVYVSSEDSGVLALAESFGAQAIKRPPELSAPQVTTQEVLSHALGQIEDRQRPDMMVLLQPTHPLRRPCDLERGLALMREDHLADSLMTVARTDELRGRIESDRYLPEFPLPRNKKKEPQLFRNTGSFYILRVERTLVKRTLFGRAIRPFVLERIEFEIDVDELSDLKLARCMLDIHKEEFVEMGYFGRETA